MTIFSPWTVGQGGHAQVGLAHAQADDGAAVLGHPPLGDVHAAHDLDAGGQRLLELLGDGEDLVEDAVHAQADADPVLLGLDVDVGGALGDAALDDVVHQSDGGGRARGVVGQVGGLDAQLVGVGRARFLGLALHLADGPLGALGAVEGRDGVVDARLGGDHGDDAAARRGAGVLLGHEVEGVGHGQVELVALGAHGHDGVLLGQVLGDQLGHLGRDLDVGEVDEVDAQLKLEGLDELALGEVAHGDELVAQALVGVLLLGQGALELVLGDDVRADQQVAEAGVLHGRSSLRGVGLVAGGGDVTRSRA